jgi:hypothetical protein
VSPSKRKKIKRRQGRVRTTATVENKPSDDAPGVGTLSGLRGGFKGLVGGGPKKKESLLGKAITYLLIAAAVGVLIWRFTR